MKQEFVADVQKVTTFPGTATVAQLAQETSMYSASPRFITQHGGPLTRQILQSVPESFYEECAAKNLFPNIDVRVHRLYPGDYPAVPGWHADGEFRPNYHAQPDLSKVDYHSHLVGTVSTSETGVSLTEVVTENFTTNLENVSPDNTLWSQVHEQVETFSPARTSLPDGQLTSLGSFTLHRATPATVRGWRLFFRLSMWHKPYLNEEEGCISRQEQIYRLSEAKGW